VKINPKGISLNLAATALGAVVLALQILLIRHILQLFLGNELTIGLSLSIWLLGSASGSLLFSKIFRNKIFYQFTPLLLLPLTVIVFTLIIYSPHLFNFLPGVPLSLGATAVIFCITILPIAILCGMLFPYLVEMTVTNNATRIAEAIKSVYIWESIGALAAGILLNFVLYSFFSSFQMVGLFLLIFYVILNRFIDTPERSFVPHTIYVYIVFAGILMIFGNTLQMEINERVFYPYTVSENTDTPYGNVKVLQLEGQSVVLTQGTIAFSIPDTYHGESHLALPLLLHPNPRRILIIGGNLSGYLPYCDKFSSLEEILFVEKDPFLIELQRNLITLRGDSLAQKVHFIMRDARHVLQSVPDSFDIILLNKAEPYTLNDNRFYTREFYQLIHSRLKTNGIFSFSIKSSENYLNPALAEYTNLLVNSLQTVLPKLYIIPGDDQIFLASRNLDIATRIAAFPDILQAYDMDLQYFSGAYLAYRTSPERLEQFRGDCYKGKHHELSSDFNLKGYLYHFKLWGAISDPKLLTLFNRLQQNRWVIFFGLLLVYVMIHIIMVREGRKFSLWNLLLVGGYSIGLEIVFLLQYQILFGTVYSTLAIIFGLFMLGLAMGVLLIPESIARLGKKKIERLIISGFIILCGILILPTISLLYERMAIFPVFLSKWVISMSFIFFNGLLTGGFFSLVTSELYQEFPFASPGLTYGVDLAGSVLAAFSISILLIPILEMKGLLLLMLIFMIIQWVWRK